jgi:hypothetical protein
MESKVKRQQNESPEKIKDSKTQWGSKICNATPAINASANLMAGTLLQGLSMGEGFIKKLHRIYIKYLLHLVLHKVA